MSNRQKFYEKLLIYAFENGELKHDFYKVDDSEFYSCELNFTEHVNKYFEMPVGKAYFIKVADKYIGVIFENTIEACKAKMLEVIL